jgi:predicted nuclease of restriction endonuclease-like (RecB) superfamily
MKDSDAQNVTAQYSGYEEFLHKLKAQIQSAQIRAALAVNRELVILYWQIGREILTRQQIQGWGAKVIDKLAQDLQRSFPEMKGFSPRNLKYMRSFAEAYPQEAIVQEVLAQIPWYHNLALLEKVKTPDERLWYAHQTLQYGWSRNILVHQIESELYARSGEAITNFERALPQPDSELAQQLLKDPYNFSFLSLSQEAVERDLEKALTNHICEFLLELGVGFAFVGRQYHLAIEDDDYYIDLLFYHTKLHCYIVIDLKMGEFQPEFSGKMNFYISAVDDLLREPEDKPTIGMILCKGKKKTAVEYALRDVHKPIGVSTYQVQHNLPDLLKNNLPTPEQLETELNMVRAIAMAESKKAEDNA